MRIGLQLYCFEPEYLAAHVDEICRFAADQGYQGVELPSLLEVRSLLRQYDLACAAFHMVPEGLNELSTVVAHLHRHRCHDLCVSGPLTWQDRRLDNFAATADFLNAKGAQLGAEGIRLHYHNHDFEFAPTAEGETPFERLMSSLDPAAVNFCLDLGWAHRGGQEPVALLQRVGNRCTYLHLRDFAGEQSVALGEGELDVPDIMASLPSHPQLEWLVVEHGPREAMSAYEVVQSSSHYLVGRCGLHLG